MPSVIHIDGPEDNGLEFDPETGYWLGEPITFPPSVIEEWRNAVLIMDPTPEAGWPTAEHMP